MAFNFHLPDIGEGVIEGEIVEWKVAEGDRIELDQPMVEVMTDKATVEIPSPRAGTISKINFDAGQICPVGDVLVIIDEDGSSAAAEPSSGGNGHSTAAVAQPVADQPTARIAAPEVIDATAGRARVLATPATRRQARKMGIDISTVPGTGRNGRVTTVDLERFAAAGGPAPATPADALGVAAQRAAAQDSTAQATSSALVRAAAPPVAVPHTELEERIPFRGMRRRIADNMVRSKFTATHFTYVEEVDMTELVELRSRAKLRAEERGIKLTYLPFIIKAICAGLKKWPALNASLDETTQEIVRKKYYHIGIAAQGPQGLVVTVIRDADRRSIFDLAGEIQRLADAVQSGTATREDLTGSTFTISSLGRLGGVMATPIINFPEVGVVGVHKMEQKPAVRAGQILVRWLMNLSISLDHRLVDGWDGAMFLQDVKSLLEDPTLMFMEMV
jgi:pyruvate dehydrogenase E2 component (dihydrolipoamide acetyltransferase)